jgi:hypothetical protein
MRGEPTLWVGGILVPGAESSLLNTVNGYDDYLC